MSINYEYIMRYVFLRIVQLLLVVTLCWKMSAQELSGDVRSVYDICLRMRSAIEVGSNTALKAAGKALAECNVGNFGTLRSIGQEPLSIDGHFVFDNVFVDSLVAGRNVYRFSKKYAEEQAKRGVSGGGDVLIKNAAVSAESSVRYSFPSKGRQELAVVTEPGGLVTLRVYDKSNGKWYNDTEDVNAGRASRFMVIDLLDDKRNLLELEIINRSGKDISFVIIGN